MSVKLCSLADTANIQHPERRLQNKSSEVITIIGPRTILITGNDGNEYFRSFEFYQFLCKMFQVWSGTFIQIHIKQYTLSAVDCPKSKY